MKPIQEIESVGWGFYCAVVIVLAGPCTWGIWLVTLPETPIGQRIALGVSFAGALAAVVAWAVNDLLHRRNVRKYEADRKADKKNERKQK